MVAALDHLTDLGHTRVAFIGGRPLGDIRDRRTAFLDYFETRGISMPDEYVRSATNDPADGDSALRDLMDLDRPPTAVVCTTDHLATGVLHAAADLGISVPGEISVVGFDDIPMASYTVPSLTTVHMPVQEMTEIAARLAMDDAEAGADETDRNFVVAPTLVVRKSTGEAPEG
jgi:LacI family transcriptional regulator